MQIVLFDLHRLKENRNLKYAAKVQPFIQITKFWKIILKVLYTQMPVPPTTNINPFFVISSKKFGKFRNYR